MPWIQTLTEFPKQQLFAKVVLVRFDSTLLLREELNVNSRSVSLAFLTIKYLYEAGARIILVSDWEDEIGSKLVDVESVAGINNCSFQL